MSASVKITSGGGKEADALVSPDGALHTVEQIYPGTAVDRRIVFRQYMTQDGTSSGTFNMLVDGSTTNIDYSIPASKTADRYITHLSFLIADASATLNKFGNVSALTNGCKLSYQHATGEVVLHEALKTNFDFVRLCRGNPFFGDGAAAFRAGNVVGTSEGYIPVLDFNDIMQPGIRLGAGTNQKIVLTIRDDINTGTVPDAFDVIAYGFDRAI